MAYFPLTPKSQKINIQTISGSASVGVGATSITIYRNSSAGAVSIQGIGSSSPLYALGLKQGITAAVVSPQDTLTGMQVTISGGGSAVAVILSE